MNLIIEVNVVGGPEDGSNAQQRDAYEDARRYALVLQQAADLMLKKNHDYGGAWKRQGVIGNLSRIMSKVARLKALRWRDGESGSLVTDETVRDTLLDLMNLSAFAALNDVDGNRWGDR